MSSVISNGINAWQSAVAAKQNKRIVDLFENGNSFRYVVPKYADKSSVLHVYPGIVPSGTGEKVVFYVIPAEYDTAAYSSNYQQYTKTCLLEYDMSSNRIPNSEAKFRIEQWKKHHHTWIPNQNATPDGLFLAFVLDRKDFEFRDTYVTLGLQTNGEQTVPFTADLIVTNIDDDTDIVYDDFSTAIPPYGPSAAASSFYLLSL